MHVVAESSGTVLSLNGKFLARGGEATIHAVPLHATGGRAMVAKVYHRPSLQRAHKLGIMVARPPGLAQNGHSWVAWPTERLLAAENRELCVGCLMPRISDARPIFEYYNPALRRRRAPPFTYRYLLRTARNLAAVFQEVHASGYIIGDVSESNVLVSDRAVVKLVDCDSWQVRDGSDVLRCCVGRPEYTPPELQGAPFENMQRGTVHDNFALAVLIWRLLMCGTHPFDGRSGGVGEPPSLATRIATGMFPHARSRSSNIRPPRAAPLFQALDRRIRDLMLCCFVEGHANPRMRPDAATWEFILYRAEEGLQTCGHDPCHQFAHRLRICPWCRQAERLGIDVFGVP